MKPANEKQPEIKYILKGEEVLLQRNYSNIVRHAGIIKQWGRRYMITKATIEQDEENKPYCGIYGKQIKKIIRGDVEKT